MDAAHFLSGRRASGELVPIPLTPGAVSGERETTPVSGGQEGTVTMPGGAGLQVAMVEEPHGPTMMNRSALVVPDGFRQLEGVRTPPGLPDGEDGNHHGGELANGNPGVE